SRRPRRFRATAQWTRLPVRAGEAGRGPSLPADGRPGLELDHEHLAAAALVGRGRGAGRGWRGRGAVSDLAAVEDDLTHRAPQRVDLRAADLDLPLVGPDGAAGVEVVDRAAGLGSHREENAVEVGQAVAAADVLVVELRPDEEHPAVVLRVEGRSGLGGAPEAGEGVLEVEAEEPGGGPAVDQRRRGRVDRVAAGGVPGGELVLDRVH